LRYLHRATVDLRFISRKKALGSAPHLRLTYTLMLWARAIIFGIPLMALSVGGWAAWRATRAHLKEGDDVVMLLPGPLPALHPFQPSGEAERQLLDLLHEPLIRLDHAGRLAPALAEQWAWHQNVSCWFAEATGLKAAQASLAAVPIETRLAWGLDEVVADSADLALVLRFAKPDAPGADDALRLLETGTPQTLTLLRIASPHTARLALEAYARHPDHAASTKRLWFDDDGTCEIVTTRTGLQAQQSLTEWLRPRHYPLPSIIPLAEVSGLAEPVLDFRMKSTAMWADGHPVTAADVRATVQHILPRQWPVASRESLRHIQAVMEPEPGLVRVIYRKRHGPALVGWTTLPILSAAWMQSHPAGLEGAPGAGHWRVASRDQRSLILESKDASASVRRLHVLAATSHLLANVGMATGSFDLVWPDPHAAWDPSTEATTPAGYRRLCLPARSQLLLLWNTRSPVLRDPRVRQALALAVDREALAQKVLGGRAWPSDSFFPPGLWFSTSRPVSAYDVQAAESLLQNAGWLRDLTGVAKSADQKPLDLTLLIPAENFERQRLASALALAWKQLGARVTVQSAAGGDFGKALSQGRFDAALVGLDLKPDWDVLPLWHSAQDLNFSGQNDPQLDLLLEALAAEFAPAAVATRAQAVEQRLAELRPAQPLFTDRQYLSVRAARFPGLEDEASVTLRGLLRATQEDKRPAVRLEMLVPDD